MKKVTSDPACDWQNKGKLSPGFSFCSGTMRDSATLQKEVQPYTNVWKPIHRMDVRLSALSASVNESSSFSHSYTLLRNIRWWHTGHESKIAIRIESGKHVAHPYPLMKLISTAQILGCICNLALLNTRPKLSSYFPPAEYEEVLLICLLSPLGMMKYIKSYPGRGLN